MAFNITHITNEKVPVELTGSNVQENPFNTAEGQAVVSVEEGFWSRKLRHGRTAFKTWDNVNLPTPGTQTNLSNFNPKVDKIFIPALITFGADTDCIFRVTYIPYPNYDPYDSGFSAEYLVNVPVAAKTPFILPLKGHIEIAYGGIMTLSATPITAAGKAYATLHGIEVSKRA